MAPNFDISNSSSTQHLSQQKIVPLGHSNSFDVGIARQLSVNAAIVYNHLVYWLRINKQKNYNQHNGKTWMYESISDMADYFGYLSEKQVSSALSQLVDSNLIIKGNYNKNKFDKTAWYCLENESALGFSKNLFEGDKRDVSKDTKGQSLYIQEEHQENVVGEASLPSFSEKDKDITKDDVYHYSIASRKDWKPEEIESAWLALKTSNASVSDPYAYIDGIIQKKRLLVENRQAKEKLKQPKEKSCNPYQPKSNKADAQHSKKELKNTKEQPSVPAISGQILQNFVSHKMPLKN